MFEADFNEARIATWKRVEWPVGEGRVGEAIIVEGGRVVEA